MLKLFLSSLLFFSLFVFIFSSRIDAEVKTNDPCINLGEETTTCNQVKPSYDVKPFLKRTFQCVHGGDVGLSYYIWAESIDRREYVSSCSYNSQSPAGSQQVQACQAQGTLTSRCVTGGKYEFAAFWSVEPQPTYDENSCNVFLWGPNGNTTISNKCSGGWTVIYETATNNFPDGEYQLFVSNGGTCTNQNVSATQLSCQNSGSNGAETGGDLTAPTSPASQTSCSLDSCTSCIITKRPDIVDFYRNQGWDTSCSNQKALIDNWCTSAGTDDCSSVKSGICSSSCGVNRKTVTRIQVEGKDLDLKGLGSVNVRLRSQSYSVPVLVSYSDGTSRRFALTFNYSSGGSTVTTAPYPTNSQGSYIYPSPTSLANLPTSKPGTPPQASLSGPLKGLVNQKLAFQGAAIGSNLEAMSILVTKNNSGATSACAVLGQDGSQCATLPKGCEILPACSGAFGEANSLPCRIKYWCKVGARQLSNSVISLSGSWTPLESGIYTVAANVTGGAGSCTGNPFVVIPYFDNKSCGTAGSLQVKVSAGGNCQESEGDLNGDGKLNNQDFEDWKALYIGYGSNVICGDKHEADLVDFNIWRYYCVRDSECAASITR